MIECEGGNWIAPRHVVRVSEYTPINGGDTRLRVNTPDGYMYTVVPGISLLVLINIVSEAA